ncbi:MULTISPECIES: extracellular solute-binding protein [unclassified Rathayibacter]|uniref:extracellular solute-binding protein n=1 Tax=unclassified Rathayibacter TaxID=2609250 RepID=UPI000CE8ADB5|nr:MULTISPECIES: extracellular solute-binding protein [unclassified Rathayibacter]PPF17138.1 ABC transporter substrate-binding protein [Rathayibacter sp. AY1A4]PPG80084.1 ABC transporter substrate-binding protein [Rathayibacter sp. AY1E5]PPH29687.1 ABC transporter substrate-binding protein [Rathayibacter sp. AY1C3]PPH65209.1 ABC transporter substrate-binding protein [Rathayibacter sp. AY1D7]PPI28742.1 ABC transporter substrate-binding protein [Rathayibacter sp. AY1B4]
MTPTHRAARWGAAILAGGLLLPLAACSSGSDSGDAGGDSALTVMIGSSGDAETTAVTDAVNAWGEQNSTTVDVVAASDLTQQLGQGFSGGNPPDLFYMSWDQFQTYASNRYLEPYAQDAGNADTFYPALRDAFSYDDRFYCEPKDFSTLGLVINTDLWAAAGLTDADVPTDWASLEAAATKLTANGVTGLSFGAEYARIGTFMNQAGGSLLSEDGTTVTADTPENVAGLTEVKTLLTDGVLKFPAALDSGWSGEAFGKGAAAMVIEGPWINGALAADYPDVNYRVAELPAGPGGKSTFTFSNCWGIPVGSATAEKTESLVSALTSDEQQLAFSDAFGVIPSTETGAAEYATKYPENSAFVSGNDYAVSPVAFAGAATVITDFNSALEGLATGDPESILGDLQTNLQDALDTANAK